MKIADIDRFFKELDGKIETPIRVLLTGGAAGILQGVERATQDIDFELKLMSTRTDNVEVIQQAIFDVAKVTGIAAQYAEDIDRWSSIRLPSKQSRLYRRIGKIEIRILDPKLWAIGKLSRYLRSDVSDLKTVLASSKVDPKACVRLWGQALGESPASNQMGNFKQQVDGFLDQHAQEIWGKKVNPEALKKIFLESARRSKKSSA